MRIQWIQTVELRITNRSIYLLQCTQFQSILRRSSWNSRDFLVDPLPKRPFAVPHETRVGKKRNNVSFKIFQLGKLLPWSRIIPVRASIVALASDYCYCSLRHCHYCCWYCCCYCCYSYCLHCSFVVRQQSGLKRDTVPKYRRWSSMCATALWLPCSRGHHVITA